MPITIYVISQGDLLAVKSMVTISKGDAEYRKGSMLGDITENDEAGELTRRGYLMDSNFFRKTNSLGRFFKQIMDES